MRQVRLTLYFLVGILLSANIILAHAETIPASYGVLFYQRYITAVGGYGTPVAYSPNTQAAKDAVTPAACTGAGGYWSGNGFKLCTTAPNDGGMYLQESSFNTSEYICPTGQNWTLSGSTCTRPDCAPPLVRDDNGSCVSQCSSKAGFKPPYVVTVSYSASGPALWCDTSYGCSVDVGGAVVCFKGVCYGSTGAYTGNSCDSASSQPDPLPKDSPEKKCVESGMGFGIANGVVVCVPADIKTSEQIKNEKKFDANGNPVSDSGSSTKKETNKNDDGSTTTITTVTNSDGSKTVTTETSKGGAGGTGDEEGIDLGTPPEEGKLTEKAIGVNSITAASFSTNASCPSPIILWGSAQFSWQPVCDVAGWLRPLVLALAWLSALLIVVGGKVGE